MTEQEARQFVEELEYAIYRTQESYNDLNEQLNSIKILITQFITFFNK